MSGRDAIQLAEQLLAGMKGESEETDDDLQAAWEALSARCEDGGPALCTDVLRTLATGLADIDSDLVGRLAICCGAVMESGADVEPAVDPFFERLPRQLELAASFAERLVEYAIDEGSEEEYGEDELEWFSFGSVPHTAITSVAAVHPEEGGAHESFDAFALGCIALLSRSKAARARAREQTGWAFLAERAGHKFLAEMLQVLDDERLLVLHPESERGWRFTIGGVADNFQLNGLLMGTLIGEGSLANLTGERPSEDAMATFRGDGPQENSELISAPWDLYNWAGIKPDGSFATEYETAQTLWIWNEGVPADIDFFEGTRTVLIAPPSYSRGFRAQRTFGGLPAQIDLAGTLATDEVRTLIQRIRDTPRDVGN